MINEVVGIRDVSSERGVGETVGDTLGYTDG